MLESHSFRPHHETHIASWGGRRVSPANPTPRQNHLLAAMPSEDYERLLPVLEPVALPVGWAIHGAGDREEHLYFLTAGVLDHRRLEARACECYAVVKREYERLFPE